MLDKNLLDVMCPDCHNRMRINVDKSPGHCYYCGRLLKYNKDTMRIEPGPGEETDRPGIPDEAHYILHYLPLYQVYST